MMAAQLRRYRCRGCRSLISVGPRGILERRLFMASAIAVALALWSTGGQSPAQVRREVSPDAVLGATAAAGWAALRRWARAVRRRALFGCVRPCPPDWPLRKVAERTTHTLASLGPHCATDGPLLMRAFAGAAHAA
jgi:hypothetical protein